MSTRTVLALIGVGRYADPWHPFRDTASPIIELLTAKGFVVESPPDVEDALARYADPVREPPALLLVNLGRPTDGDPSPRDAQARAGLENLVAHSPILAMHASANAFEDAPEWEEALGGRWIPGVSWHPPRSRTRVHLGPEASRLPGVSAFETEDERYLDLRLADDLRVLLEFDDEQGGRAPAMWMRTAGPHPVVYDALGHDSLAFDDPGHLAALGLAIDALTQRSS